MDSIPYPATPMDYGSVYASKSFLSADNRRLWLGWVFEVRVGRVDLFLCARARASCRQTTAGCGWDGCLRCVWSALISSCVRELLVGRQLQAVAVMGV